MRKSFRLRRRSNYTALLGWAETFQGQNILPDIEVRLYQYAGLVYHRLGNQSTKQETTERAQAVMCLARAGAMSCLNMQDLCVIVGRGNRSTKQEVVERAQAAKQGSSDDPAAETDSASGVHPAVESPLDGLSDTAEERVTKQAASTETADDSKSATPSAETNKWPRKPDYHSPHRPRYIGSTVCKFLEVTPHISDLPGSVPLPPALEWLYHLPWIIPTARLTGR